MIRAILLLAALANAQGREIRLRGGELEATEHSCGGGERLLRDSFRVELGPDPRRAFVNGTAWRVELLSDDHAILSHRAEADAFAGMIMEVELDGSGGDLVVYSIDEGRRPCSDRARLSR